MGPLCSRCTDCVEFLGKRKKSQRMDTNDWRKTKNMAERYLYMFQNEIGCDVTFGLGPSEKKIHTHRFILISRSAVFEAMFCGSMAERVMSRVIPIPDIEEDVFLSFLRFLYVSEISLTEMDTLPILYVARKYCVEDLVKQCADFLRAKMTPETVSVILEQAHVYDIDDLKDMCLKFIFENGKSVLNSSGFLDLCFDCVHAVIGSDDLYVEESIVYEALMSWAEKECSRKNQEIDGPNKRAILSKLFFLVRFPVMEPTYFTDVVSNDTVLTEQEKILLFQYMFGTTRTKQMPFPVFQRQARVIKCLRFPIIPETDEISCEPGFKNSNFGIDVKCSDDVMLQGLLLFGACSSSISSINDQHLKITISAVPHQSEVYTYEFDGIEIPQQKTYEVLLGNPLRLKKEKLYAVQVKLDLFLPYQTYFGKDGIGKVCSGSVEFEFFTHQSLIATTVDKGQIAGLLFSKG